MHMKQFTWILLLLLVASPAWSASTKKISVQQLKDLLISLQDAKKTDDQVATELKQSELTEELTPVTMNALAAYIPGPLSTEQLYVLEARSAILPPPAADLPAAAPLDPAAQQALLAKASDYVNKTYSQLPLLTASKMTARFQDGVEAIHTVTGAHNKMDDAGDPLWDQTSLYVRLLNTHTDTIQSENGIEKPSSVKDKTQWGPNNMVASIGQPLTLSTVLQEASASGSLKWLRWETIDGKQIAVLGFSVDKKKTKFTVNYCCFPDTDTVGGMSYGMAKGGGSSAPSSTTPSAKSNMATVSDWKPFKSNIGYHGELFIDPDTGIVVRTVTQADFKPSDFVHSEAIRKDYAALTIGGKLLVVPVRSFNISEVVPNGDSFAAKYAVRHTFITEDFKDYQLASK
jgi:hypothetical protein